MWPEDRSRSPATKTNAREIQLMKTAVAIVVLVAALVGLSMLMNKGAPLSNGVAPQSTGSTASQQPSQKANGVDYTKVPDKLSFKGKQESLTTTSSGLKYYDAVIGTGPVAQSGQSVSVQYTGTLVDGTKFDSSFDRGSAPFTFNLGGGNVIAGWDEGVQGMKVGGRRWLVIPGNLAYGSQAPSPKIPANATLVFDIQLVGVK
jgi:FKBP-type peptidyl-prolyl cis-trans isomerase